MKKNTVYPKSKILWKYKSLETVLDLTRILDIIKNKKIYLPRYGELNDPYESYMNCIYTYEAGTSISHNIGIRKESVDKEFNKYGILSLTSNCKNQVMWTMYANYYNGVCMGFEKLSNAKKITYRKTGENGFFKSMDDPKFTQKDIIDTLMTKYDLWEYEEEYRVISTEKFLDVSKKLKFIILGQRLDNQIKEILYNECIKAGINVYETLIIPTKNKIIIKSYGYDIKCDGSEIKDDLDL
mgnify:CR=1 FL=1